jgi:phage shock protein E
MNWTPLLTIGAVVAVVFILKRTGQISARDALAHLRNGALIIDVRSPGEFNSGHLPGAINLPLDDIETSLPTKVKDKSRPLLLHCASGMRSGMAQRKLKGLGYTNAFNLGAYGRAERLVESSK